jgi:hypothetical protein
VIVVKRSVICVMFAQAGSFHVRDELEELIEPDLAMGRAAGAVPAETHGAARTR